MVRLMPIRPELKKFYGVEWRAVRARILARAGNCCEQCGKPDRLAVWVYSSQDCGQYWSLCLGPSQDWIYCLYGGGGNFRLNPSGTTEAQESGRLRLIRVVLTIAHLNHVAGDDRDENLKALCQWCHLNFDVLHHKQSRSIRKDANRPLLENSPEQGHRPMAAAGKDHV
jgi:hypothetical protein